MSLDRPRTTDNPVGEPGRVSPAQTRLARLGANLSAQKFVTDLQAEGLVVRNPEALGCCANNPHLADTITCRARAEDDGRLWFFSSAGEPIAEADNIPDAVVWLKGRLAPTGKEAAPRSGVTR